MERGTLINNIAESLEWPRSDVQKVLNAFEQAITEALVNREEVTLKGFIKFSLSERKARQGHNPSTGEPMEIPASTGVRVSVLSRLKQAVKGAPLSW